MNSIKKNSIRKYVAYNCPKMLVSLCMFFTITISIAQVKIGQDIEGLAANDYFGFNVSISANGKRTVIGAIGHDSYRGQVRIFEEINGTWTQIGQDIDGESQNDRSGTSVSISSDGKRIAIGAPRNNGNGQSAGHVRIYEETNGTWNQIGQDIDGESADDQSGMDVSISQDGLRIAIGAQFNDGAASNAGQVRVYEELNGNWVQIGQDIDGEAQNDLSGVVSISANGTRVAIGAVHNDLDRGHTRVYEESNGTWVQIGQDIDGEALGDYAGNSISISADGSKVAIGAFENNNSTGHVRVYQEVNGNWIQFGQDIDGDTPFGRLGMSVSFSSDGTRIAIGNQPASQAAISRVKIYELQNSAWNQLGVDILGDYPGNKFGFSTSISDDGERVVVGSYTQDVFFTAEGISQIYQISENPVYSNYLTGNVLHDLNVDCLQDSLDPGLHNWFLQAAGANGISYGLSDINGNYSINVDSGSYQLSIIPPNALWTACQPKHIVTVSGYDTLQTDFIVNAVDCPHLVVDISAPFVRRCFTTPYSVYYCNEGTIPATNTYLEVEFPTQMQVDSSAIPWNSQSGNLFSFSLGTINPGVCSSFKIYVTTICDSTVIGETMCVEAHIFPDSTCVPPDPSWDGSITTLDVECAQDSVTFTIKNTGVGDMLNPLEYFVIEDELILKQGTFHLISMDSILVKVPSNGSTYRLYAGQSPGHFPTTYFPSIAIEGCGVNSNGTFSLGYITMFDDHDYSDQISMDCQEIIGSFDPNDKRAEPKGYGSEHYINVGDDLNYHIRFQNVGTDTAFTVVIRDTISPHLNLASLQNGASSHPYQFDVVNGNILTFTFDNILLVDSSSNEPASHGFVKFKISQIPSLPIGTMIYNSAGIYFDFNEPVITNKTYHEIGEDFIPIIATSSNPVLEYPNVAISVRPNPFTNYADFVLDGAPSGNKSFELYDVMGRLIHQANFSDNSKHRFYKTDLTSGIYFYKILNNDNLLISGKLVAGQ